MDKLSKGEISDLAVTYAVWLLHDGGVSVDADKLQTVISAAGVDVPAFYTKIYAKAVTDAKKLDEIVSGSTSLSAGPAPAAAAAPAAGGAGAAPAKAEEKKPEKDDEDDDVFGDGDGDGGMGRFGGGNEDDY